MPSANTNPMAQWVSEVTGVQNPFEVTLPTGEVVMPTPGLQDADDDYVSVSELLRVHYINLEDDSADVSEDATEQMPAEDALEYKDLEEHDFEASERAFEDDIAKGNAARDAAAAQNEVAEGWKAASVSMRDAQKALQAAEQSYRKLQHDFAGQAKRTVET